MATALAEVSRDELRRLVDGGETFALVDALSPTSYAASHLPGAINIPPEWVDERARRLIPDRATKVVVYCLNPSCESSAEVAGRLIALGYRDVGHYAEGKRGWRDAGLPLEGGRRRQPS